MKPNSFILFVTFNFVKYDRYYNQLSFCHVIAACAMRHFTLFSEGISSSSELSLCKIDPFVTKGTNNVLIGQSKLKREAADIKCDYHDDQHFS